MTASMEASCRNFSISMSEGDDLTLVSDGLPIMTGAREDTTDGGKPAEVKTPTND